MTVAELNTVKTAYLRNELFKEICGFHHIELRHRDRALLYVSDKYTFLVAQMWLKLKHEKKSQLQL